MTTRKFLTSEDIQKIGLRMKSCRVLTGLNQEEFADKHRIPYTTIRNWEYGKVVPRLSGMNEFIDALKKDSVYVECEWVLYGEGYGPSFIAHHQQKEENLNIENPETSLLDLFKEQCRNNRKTPVICNIDDDYMSPWFYKGDIVTGILINHDQIEEELEKSQNDNPYPVLVRLQDGKYYPRWVKKLNQDWIFMSNHIHTNLSNSPSVAHIAHHFWNNLR